MEASIVIPTYNKLTRLKATLESLKTLDYSRECFEVVVVDDGSEDETASFLSGVGLDFQLRVFRHQSNQGRAAARNTGVRQARGRVVVFLDDDMEAAPELLMAHMRGHAEGHKMVVLGNVRRAPGVRSTALVRYLDSRGVHKLKPGQPVPFRYFATGNVSVERRLLMEVGLFDERFRKFGGEDLELGYRLDKAGARFVYAPQARSYRTDYRDVPGLCEAMVTYGEHSLPLIVKMHPELNKLVKAHLLEPAALFSEPFSMTVKKALFRLALCGPLGAFVVLLVRFSNPLYVPAILFDYLIVFHYLKGLSRSWRRQGRGVDETAGPCESSGLASTRSDDL
jgi:glycosyltransferase involved in cell wall biosynthesis